MRRRWSFREWAGAHPLRADSVLAGAILLTFSAVLLGAGPLPPADQLLAFVAGGVLGTLPVALRRHAPLVAVALACAVLVVGAVFQIGPPTASVSILVVAYTCAAHLPVRTAVASTAALGVTSAGVLLAERLPPGELLGNAVAGGLALLVSFFVGRTVFTRRAYTAALEERARVAEANRESAARQAVLDERARIARELHDVVAHHVSVMGVMAAGARRALTRDPSAADEALATIESTGRATLREMRRLLDVLRDDDSVDGRPDAGVSDTALAPQPGVAELELLVGQVREAGLPVALEVRGRPRPLDPGVDRTVYRIVQEALTNTLKHAGPAAATVTVGYTPHRLELRVEDDGRGPAVGAVREPAGHGLVGMRERVSLYGGTLRVGLRTGGGFAVAADIPLDPVAVEPAVGPGVADGPVDDPAATSRALPLPLHPVPEETPR